MKKFLLIGTMFITACGALPEKAKDKDDDKPSGCQCEKCECYEDGSCTCENCNCAKEDGTCDDGTGKPDGHDQDNGGGGGCDGGSCKPDNH